MVSTRVQLGALIVARLNDQAVGLRAQWNGSTPTKHFVLDDLLSIDTVNNLVGKFPAADALMLRSSLRERKRVGVELAKYDALVSEFLFAFQEPGVVTAIGEITGIVGMEADPSLYASGISVMGKGDFLNPHLDNSHDADQAKYRAVNLLFYVSPDWKEANGGNFELWEDKVIRQKTIVAQFNRLVVMATDQKSWHSVNKVESDQPRLCVSNYFFTPTAPGGEAYGHVTTFAGRPEEKVKRVVLAVDGMALNALGKMFPFLLKRSKHRVQDDKKPKA